jgi:hypothetical protein
LSGDGSESEGDEVLEDFRRLFAVGVNPDATNQSRKRASAKKYKAPQRKAALIATVAV